MENKDLMIMATPFQVKSREFANTGLPDYMFAHDLFARSGSLLANNFNPTTANSYPSSTETTPSEPPTQLPPPTSLSSTALSGSAQKMSSAQQQRGGAGAAPHPFVPGSHLLMSNSQPPPTVPNIGTQTIGAPTSLGKFRYNSNSD